MVRIPNTPRVEQIVAFPEPDHSTEFKVQEIFEMTRDGGWAHAYEGVDDRPHGWLSVEEVMKLEDMWWDWAYVGVEEDAREVEGPQGAYPADSQLGSLHHDIAERGQQERAALYVWRKGGRKGSRPSTAAIEALGRRRGCTPARED